MFAKKSTNMADDKRTAFHKTSLSTKINRSGHVSLAQTRRHSWFGNLLDFSDDKGYSRSDKNNNKKLSKNLLTALDLKTDRILEDQQNFKENDKATESGKSFYFAFMVSGRFCCKSTNFSCYRKRRHCCTCSKLFINNRRSAVSVVRAVRRNRKFL